MKDRSKRFFVSAICVTVRMPYVVEYHLENGIWALQNTHWMLPNAVSKREVGKTLDNQPFDNIPPCPWCKARVALWCPRCGLTCGGVVPNFLSCLCAKSPIETLPNLEKISGVVGPAQRDPVSVSFDACLEAALGTPSLEAPSGLNLPPASRKLIGS